MNKQILTTRQLPFSHRLDIRNQLVVFNQRKMLNVFTFSSPTTKPNKEIIEKSPHIY